MGLITVAVVYQLYEAHMLKTFLEEEGITVFLFSSLFYFQKNAH
jgi:hypothetical protein